MKSYQQAATNGLGYNHARIGWDDSDLQRSIIDRFERIVRQYPHRRAVNTPERQLTYDELNRTANRLARAIVAGQGSSSEPVVLFMDEPSAMITAILGVLKAGKIYVPLDAASSEERLRSILEDCQTKCIVMNDDTLRTVERVHRPKTQLINTDSLDERLSTENISLALGPNTLSSIIYTSGSTGVPKGVLEDHKYILRIIRDYSEDVGICPDDNLILLFSLSSNGSLGNLFGALLNGATVHCPDLKRGEVTRLAAWLKEEKITIYYSSASFFRSFVETLQAGELFPEVRIVQLSAEPVLPRDMEACRRHFSSKCIFINRFGTTEVGPFLQHKIDLASPFTENVLPVGSPLKGVKVHIIDDDGNEVGPNATGQMVVQSRCLALGYWNKPELTATKFLPDPSGGEERLYLTGDLGRMTTDGCFFHVGRKDFQVKIRGYRVDTGEVEMILLAYAGIKQAAVLGQRGNNDETCLVAYYVPAQNAELTGADLRDYLRERLPEYMVPSLFIKLEALPTAPSGKVDRRALPSLETVKVEAESPFVSARTPVEETLAALWMEILGAKRVGIHDNFLELGGHSLNATQVVSRVSSTFGVELPIRTIFEAATVAMLAEEIEQALSVRCSKEVMFH